MCNCGRSMEVERLKNKNGNTVVISYDSDLPSPREWVNLGTFITWQRRYHSPDKNPFESPNDFKEYIQEEHPDSLILPVYKYEHSGVAYSTSPFSCPWDSGQVGYIYVTKEEIIKEYGSHSEETLEKAKERLEGEVSVYSSWANGDIFRYEILDNEGEEIDGGCGGFYGSDHKISGLAESANL
mgnify:CR=1 FL=1